jgi:hypothetical protein
LALQGGSDLGRKVPVDQAILDQVVSHYGPALAGAFMRQISGNATRTDLADFALVIRAYLKRDPRAKQWLEQALNGHVPQAKVDDAHRRAFLQKIAM